MHAPHDPTEALRRGRALFALLLFFLVAFPALAQTTITVTPDPLWNPTFDAAFLSGLPGMDFTSTQPSPANQVTINIPGLSVANAQWIVSIHKTDIAWDSTITLWIMRTGNGTNPNAPPAGTISGGTTLQQITGVSTEFYRGRRTRTGVTAQLEVQGLSVVLGARTLTTTVTFTVTEY